MKIGDVLIVIGVTIVAFILAVFLVSRGNLDADGQLIVVLSSPVGAGFLSAGLLFNYRRSN